MPTSVPPPQSPEVFPERGEPGGPPVGRDPGGIHAGPADDPNTPAAIGSRADRREGIVDDPDLLGKTGGPVRALESAQVAGRVGAGHGAGRHRRPRPRAGECVQPRGPARLVGQAGEPVRTGRHPDDLVRGGRPANGGEQPAVRADEHEFGLGVPAVDREDGHGRRCLVTHAQLGRAGTSSSSSMRTKTAPASRSRATVAGTASRVPRGQL